MGKKKTKKKTTIAIADATREALKETEKENASLKATLKETERALLEAGYEVGDLRRLLDQASQRESVLAHNLRVARGAADQGAEDYGRLVAKVATRNEIRAGKDPVFRRFLDNYRGTRKAGPSWTLGDDDEEKRSKAIAAEFGWIDRSIYGDSPRRAS